MRKIIGIVTALFILSVFVGAASATFCPSGSDCAPSTSQPYIKDGWTGFGDVKYSGTSTGYSEYDSWCGGISKTTTIAGKYGPDSGFSQTTTSSGVDFPGETSGWTSASSGFQSV